MKTLDWSSLFAKLPKRASSACVSIENENKELLVVKAHYKPYWSMPGGWVEQGQTPRQAAVNEAFEEIGLEISEQNLELVSVIDRITPQADTYLFVFRYNQPIAKSSEFELQSSEIAAYDWVSREEVSGGVRCNYNAAVKNWASDSPQSYVEHNLKTD